MTANADYACDLCRQKKYKLLYRLHSRDIVVCSHCQLVSAHPIPSSEELNTLYHSLEYLQHPYFQFEEEQSSRHFFQMTKAADFAKTQLRPNDKLLDIGSGRGAFLNLCEHQGINAEGMEVSSEAVGLLRQKFKFPIHQGTLEEFSGNGQAYAMITAFDILEHVRSPRMFLDQIYALLKPGGHLIFSTVNIYNALDVCGRWLYRLNFRKPVSRLYPSYHLYYFKETTLREYLKTCRYQIRSVIQENYDSLKASQHFAEQIFLRGVYLLHDLSGHKTNFYVYAQKTT